MKASPSKSSLEDEKWIQFIKPTRLGAELLEFEDNNQYANRDLPDNKVFVDLGLNVRENDHLYYQQINDRDFRERCVQLTGRNYVLFEKGYANIKPPTHTSFEGIAAMLGCDDQFEFEFGLDLMLEGLERLRQAEVPAKS